MDSGHNQQTEMKKKNEKISQNELYLAKNQGIKLNTEKKKERRGRCLYCMISG